MDDRQKNNIRELTHALTNKVKPNELAELLRKAKLVKQERIQKIFDSFSSAFTLNLQLFSEAIESDSPTAYADLSRIVEQIDPDLFNRSKVALALNSKKEGTRKTFSAVCNFFSQQSPETYPLGMKSGGRSSTQTLSSQGSTSGSGSFCNDSKVLSPSREKHKTAITAVGDLLVMSNNGVDDEFNSRWCSTVQPNFSGSQSPVNSPTTTVSRAENGTHPSVPMSPTVNRCSQTPVRQRELPSFRNLSLIEEDNYDQYQHEEADFSKDGEEPVMTWHPYAQSPTHDSTMQAGSPHRCAPSYSSASSESGESIADSHIVDSLVMDSNVMTAIAQGGAHMMSVTLSTSCHNNPEEDYKMTSKPRGKCLIVNNINFEAEMFPTRKGSDEDANRFDQIFKQLGFETIMTRNLTADEMRDKFKELSEACKPEHDAVFVFILSHGSEHGIYGADGIEVHLDSEIISCFDNRNCKAMIGKPKVFVIQACRGRSKDYGGEGDTTDSIGWPASVTTEVESNSASQDKRVPASWLPTTKPSDGKKRKHPIRTDMLLVFSCLAGFVSVRNETAGSWLGVALAYFIMTHAHERDLLRILNLVTSDIIQRESTNGHIQSIELKLLGWTKNLYFNPGIYL